MADLSSTKVFGKLTVIHDAILKANAEITGNVNVTGIITGNGSGLTALNATEILTAIKTVDGSTSGLDADLLDGQHASAFAASSHNHSASDITTGTLTRPIQTSGYRVAHTTAFSSLSFNSGVNVYRIDVSSDSMTIYANSGLSAYSAPVVFHITGNNTITWNGTINWSGGAAPELNASWTVVTFLWQGSGWYGFKSGGAD